MSTATSMSRKKDFMTGYTGHVPKKQLIFGMTTGDTGRLLKDDKGTDKFYEGNHIKGVDRRHNKSAFDGNNYWIGGPTSNFMPQKVPGYTGHVPSVKAENLFAKSFARITGRAHKLGTKRVNCYSQRQKMKSQNTVEYNPYNFTRLMKEPELLENIDYKDYASYVNKEIEPSKRSTINQSASINDDLIVTQKPSRSPFNSFALSNSIALQKNNFLQNMKSIPQKDRNSLTSSSQFMSEVPSITQYGKFSQNKHNVSPIKPRLVERKIATNRKFLNMSTGFQKVFTKDKSDQQIIIPIAGYAGHRVGYHSKNIYGKPFRKCSIESKRIQRLLNSKPSF